MFQDLLNIEAVKISVEKRFQFFQMHPTVRRNSLHGSSPGLGSDHKIHERIIRRRQSLSLFSKIQDFDENIVGDHKLFDQLLIIGARPHEEFLEGAAAEILVVYPSTPQLLGPLEYACIPSFCFPQGFSPTDPEQVKRESVTSQFVFEISGGNGNTKYLGVCTIFSLLEARDMFFFNKFSKKYPTAICLLSSNPILSAQFTYGTFLARWLSGKVRGYRKREIEVPPITDENEPLPGMVSAKGCLRLGSFLVPNVFLTEMAYVSNIKLNPDRETDLPLVEGKKIRIPSLKRATKSVIYAGMDALFTALTIENVIKCVSLMLLEKQLVFLGSDEFMLSMSVLCLRELLMPFKYQGTLLPIMPNTAQFFNILESPVPFVCGIVKGSVQRSFPDHLAIVDLDVGQITDPDNVPLIPKAKKIKKQITKLFQKRSKDITVPPAKSKIADKASSPAYFDFVVAHLHPLVSAHTYIISPKKYIFPVEVVDQIVGTFRELIAPKIEKLIAPCFVSDTTDIENPVTIFNKELFLDSMGKKARPFFSEFVNTTMFQEFCDGKTDEKEKVLSQHMMRGPASQSIPRSSLAASTFDVDSIPVPAYDI